MKRREFLTSTAGVLGPSSNTKSQSGRDKEKWEIRHPTMDGWRAVHHGYLGS